MRKSLLFLWVVMLAVPLCGSDNVDVNGVSIKIDAPKSAEVGDLVTLSVCDDSEGSSLAWEELTVMVKTAKGLVEMPPVSKVSIEGGRRLIFAAKRPGTYTFKASRSVAASSGPPVVISAKVSVVIIPIDDQAEDGPIDPGSPPKPNPEDKYGISGDVSDLRMLVSKEDRQLFKKLAESYRQTAKDIAAGSVKDKDSLIALQKSRNAAILGTKATKFKPVFSNMGRMLDVLVSSGKLDANNINDYGFAWAEISAGLDMEYSDE